MSRSGEDVYEASTHKKHVIPMVYIKKEADWKAWRSGLAVAAKTVGLPHVLMSMAVDRDKVEQLKKTGSKLKKKKKKLTQAKKVVKAPATPMRQAVKAEEVKVEVPEPRYEEIAFPEIQEGTTQAGRAEILAKYETKVRDNQRKYNAAVKDWLIEKAAMERSDAHVSDLEDDSDIEITEGFSLGYEAGGSEKTLTMDKEEARLFNPQVVFKNLITNKLEDAKESVARSELWGWVKISVKGGKFAYLIESCPILEDILWIYDKIKKACNSPSIFAHATLLYTFFSKPRSASDLHKTNVEIEEEANHIELVCETLNHPFKLSSHIRRALLIYHVMREDPKGIRERTIDKLCSEEPEFDRTRMLEELDVMQLKYEQMHTHDQGRGGPSRANSATTRPGATRQAAGGGTSDSGSHPCYGFNSEKGCEKNGCKFAHRKMTKEESGRSSCNNRSLRCTCSLWLCGLLLHISCRNWRASTSQPLLRFRSLCSLLLWLP